MAFSRQRCILAGLLFGSAVLSAAPSASFEIFGIRLWGERQDDDEIEVIDPLPYTVTIRVSGGDDDTEQALQTASALWRDRAEPASGRGGLLAKARGDYRRLLATLYDEGYYGPDISIRAAGREVADLTLGADLPAEVPMTIDVATGPRFRFGRAEIVNAPPGPRHERDTVATPASIGFETGRPARAVVIGEASALAVEQWRQFARAKARETEREVIADHQTSLLDATIVLDPGPRVRYGPVRVVGASRTDPAFILYMADLHQGDGFDPDEIATAQARLARVGVFSSIRIEEAETVGPGGSLPMTIRVQERRPRTIGAGASLSTIDGLGMETYWLHRNFLGRAEQLRFEASVDGLGLAGSPYEYDYNFGVTFTKPGVLNPDTSFFTSAVARQLDLDTYRERSITGRAGLSRTFGNRLTGDLFAEISRARYEDDFGIRHFTTFALVGRAQYDRRDNPLDATRGYYLAAELRPFYEFVYGNPAVSGTLEGRAYRSLGTESRFVLAGRAKVGSYFGPDAAETPPNVLFFAGGGGSVRGYAYRSIGVEVEIDGDPGVIGGSGLVEASAEFRARFGERFGGVAFVDAGVVGEDSIPSFDNDVRVGAGLGFRYFTGIGPIRVDLATPINPRPEDSAVALYIGIGQAF